MTQAGKGSGASLTIWLQLIANAAGDQIYHRFETETLVYIRSICTKLLEEA